MRDDRAADSPATRGPRLGRRSLLRRGLAGFALTGSGVATTPATARSGESTPTHTVTGARTQTSSPFSQQEKLAPTDGDSEDFFGNSAALSGDGTTAIVGAHQDEDPNGNLAGSAYIFTESEEAWSQEKITAKDGDDNDQFGVSAALSGDGTTAIIGANLAEDSNGTQAGSAYVFTESEGTWSQQQKLTANDGDSGDRFGSSVAVSNDGVTAIVGAGADGDSGGVIGGSAYVFKKIDNTWSRQQKLTVNDGDSGERFGSSIEVSSDGTTALIGAHDYGSENREEAGLGYVFSESEGTWSQQQKLTASAGRPAQTADFGTSVTISDDGTTALIGVRFDEPEPSGQDAGSAYVFTESEGTWSQQQKLTANDGDSGDNFGSTVTVSNDGTTALIGAFLDADPNGPEAGSAYVFTRSDGRWSQQQKLSADDGDNEDFFGGSVVVSSDGTTALIGAFGDEDPNGPNAGSAYVFTNQEARTVNRFDPAIHGFGFKNWGIDGGGFTPPHEHNSITEETFRTEFDQEWLPAIKNSIPVPLLDPIVTEAFEAAYDTLRRGPEKLWSDGHCYGMCVVAERYFETSPPDSLPDDPTIRFDLPAASIPKPSGEYEQVGTEIDQEHREQFFDSRVVKEVENLGPRTPQAESTIDAEAEVKAIRSAIERDGTALVGIGTSPSFYASISDVDYTRRLHQLIATRVTVNGSSLEDAPTATIEVYDPNQPATFYETNSRQLTVDVSTPTRQPIVNNSGAGYRSLYQRFGLIGPARPDFLPKFDLGKTIATSFISNFTDGFMIFAANSPVQIDATAPDGTQLKHPDSTAEGVPPEEVVYLTDAPVGEYEITVEGTGSGAYGIEGVGSVPNAGQIETAYSGRISTGETQRLSATLPEQGEKSGTISIGRSGLTGIVAEYDTDGDGTITAGELGNAVIDFVQGELRARDLGKVVIAFVQS